MTAPDLQILTQIFAERLLNSAAAGLILTGLVWLLLRVVGRQNASTRFAVWFSALLAMVAFPFVSASTFAHLPFRASTAAALHGPIVLAASWAFYLFSAWVAVVVLLLFRLVVGVWRVHALRCNCTDLDLASFPPAVSAVFQTVSSRRVSLCTSCELAVPAAVGLFRPAIVFPEELLPQLADNEIEMIVRHELAHLARWDDWTNLIQKLVKTLLFFHPAVWWVETRLTLEREMACDDVVLAQTASPRAYASSLISFAEKLHCARGLALAQALVSRIQQMPVRVAQILDSRRPSRTGLWKPVMVLSTGLLVATFSAAPYMPRLIAFQSQPGQAPASLPMLSTATDATAGRSVVVPASLQRELASRPRAIQTAFHPHAAPHAKLVKAKTPRTPLVLRTSSRQRPIVQETIFILQRPPDNVSTPSMPEGWTLCIWTWDRTNANGQQLQSAILVRWI